MLGEATAHQREPGCTTPRCMVASTLHYDVATCLVKKVDARRFRAPAAQYTFRMTNAVRIACIPTMHINMYRLCAE